MTRCIAPACRPLGLVIACGLVSVRIAAAVEPSPSPDPAAIVWGVNGQAIIRSHQDGSERPAELLVPIMVGDSVKVSEGTITIADLRLHTEQQFGAGTEMTWPPTHAERVANYAVYSQLVEKLRELQRAFRSPEQTTGTWVRGRSLRFAPDARIVFRWPPALHARELRLQREGDSSLLYEAKQPTSPLPWPAEVGRTPGTYEWRVFADDGKEPSFVGALKILTSAEAQRERQAFQKEAEKLLPGKEVQPGVAWLTEILAARDGCFLR